MRILCVAVIVMGVLFTTGCGEAFVPDSVTLGTTREQSYWREGDYLSLSLGVTWYLK